MRWCDCEPLVILLETGISFVYYAFVSFIFPSRHSTRALVALSMPSCPLLGGPVKFFLDTADLNEIEEAAAFLAANE